MAHGPKPRDYRQRTPKKMIRLALRSALSDRAAEGKVLVVDEWGIDEPSTKAAIELLAAVGLRTAGERDERVLLVLDRDEDAVWKSFRNLGERVQIVIPDELNTYDVLVNDWLVFTKATLEDAVARFGRSSRATAEGATPGTPAPSERDQEAGAANEQQEPPRHHHPAGGVGEVVRRVRRERLHVRRRRRRQQDRDPPRRSRRSSACGSPTSTR